MTMTKRPTAPPFLVSWIILLLARAPRNVQAFTLFRLPTAVTPLIQCPHTTTTTRPATLAPDTASLSFNETDHSSTKSRNFSDDYCFNQALDSLAKCAGDARQPVIRRAAACQDMWQDFLSSPQDHWAPDIISFNTVLKAWSCAAGVLLDQHSDASTPEHLLDPDIHVFSARDCAQRTQELLDHNEHLFLESNSENVMTSFNIVMDCWAKCRTQEALPEIQALIKRAEKRKLPLDRYTYGSLIEAVAYSGKSDCFDEIEKIYRFMEASKDSRVTPNVKTLVVLMRAYSRVARLLKEADDWETPNLLANHVMKIIEQQEERYEKTQNAEDLPDEYLYTAGMDVMAKIATRDAALRAEELWTRMKTAKDHPDKKRRRIRPTIYSYTTIITAWSRVTAAVPQASQRVYDLMQELWEDRRVRLNHRPFTAALRGISASEYPIEEEPDKAVLALKVVKRMRKEAQRHRALQPNRSLYHAAIDCCGRVQSSHMLAEKTRKDGSTVQSRMAALKIAFALLKTMKLDHIEPSEVTYAKLLLCVSNLLPPGAERTTVADSLFQQAKHDGVADKKFLQTLRRTVDASYWETFVRDNGLLNEFGRIDWRKVPHTWYKHGS